MDSPAPNYLQRAVAEKKREKRWGGGRASKGKLVPWLQRNPISAIVR